MGAMERITIDVPAEVAATLRQGVEAGGYESEGQIVSEAMRDWTDLQLTDGQELHALRAAVAESDASGPGLPADEVFAEIEELIASYEKPR